VSGAHAFALPLLVLHPDLLLGFDVYDVDRHDRSSNDRSSDHTARRGASPSQSAWSRSPVRSIGLRSVALVGGCLTATGVGVMWRLWLSGRGNANYLYFQALAFHAMQVVMAHVRVLFYRHTLSTTLLHAGTTRAGVVMPHS